MYWLRTTAPWHEYVKNIFKTLRISSYICPTDDLKSVMRDSKYFHRYVERQLFFPLLTLCEYKFNFDLQHLFDIGQKLASYLLTVLY